MILNQFTPNELVTIIAYTLCSPFLVYTNAIKVDYIRSEERQKGRVFSVNWKKLGMDFQTSDTFSMNEKLLPK
jgi:hypothetical protein